MDNVMENLRLAIPKTELDESHRAFVKIKKSHGCCLKAKDTQLRKLFHIRHCFQTFHHFGHPPLDMIQLVNVPLELWCPELDPVFQVLLNTLGGSLQKENTREAEFPSFISCAFILSLLRSFLSLMR